MPKYFFAVVGGGCAKREDEKEAFSVGNTMDKDNNSERLQSILRITRSMDKWLDYNYHKGSV